MTPVQATDPYDWQAILTLIQSSFADMESRINPPSSMHQLTPEQIAKQSKDGEIWVIENGATLAACCFLTRRSDCLYLGKMAITEAFRGRGLSRQLVDVAKQRADGLGIKCLRLETRIELVENHAIFAALGFRKTGETAHHGFDRPTGITMEMMLQ